MNQKETFDSTVKNHHLNPLVSFDCRDDLVHLRKHFGAEDVERWVVNVTRQYSGERRTRRISGVFVAAYFDPSCLLPLYHFGFTFGFCVGVVLSGSFRHAVLMRWSYIRKLE